MKGPRPAIPGNPHGLLLEISRFVRASGVPETRLGREAVGDRNLARDLRLGRRPRRSVRIRVRAYIGAGR